VQENINQKINNMQVKLTHSDLTCRSPNLVTMHQINAKCYYNNSKRLQKHTCYILPGTDLMFPPETEIVILWYKGSGGKGRNGNFPPEIFGCQKTVKKSNSCKKIPPNSAEFGAKNLFFGNLGTK